MGRCLGDVPLDSAAVVAAYGGHAVACNTLTTYRRRSAVMSREPFYVLCLFCMFYRDCFDTSRPNPHLFSAPSEEVPIGIGYRHKGSKKLQRWGYQTVEKVLRWV